MPQGEGTYGDQVGRPSKKKESGFKMRSGNTTAFKMMGSSPNKQSKDWFNVKGYLKGEQGLIPDFEGKPTVETLSNISKGIQGANKKMKKGLLNTFREKKDSILDRRSKKKNLPNERNTLPPSPPTPPPVDPRDITNEPNVLKEGMRPYRRLKKLVPEKPIRVEDKPVAKTPTESTKPHTVPTESEAKMAALNKRLQEIMNNPTTRKKPPKVKKSKTLNEKLQEKKDRQKVFKKL